MSKKIVIAIIAVLTVLSLACGTSNTEKLQEVAPTVKSNVDEPVPTTSIEEGKEVDDSEPKQSPTSEPTVTPKPTATPKVELLDVTISNFGFGQDDQSLGFAFVLKNPNPGHAFEDMQYQAAAYDEDDTVVETDSGYINLILPEQQLGFAGTMWLDEDVEVARIEIQLKQGDSVATEPLLYFTTESVTYYAGDYSTNVTGVINNPFERSMIDLRVSAVLYNDAGEIVGGGYTFHNFILAEDSNGVEISVTDDGNVTNVELYPIISGLTFLFDEPEIPEGAVDIKLLDIGGGQDGLPVGYAFILENTNTGFSVEDSLYHVTVYAEDGAVLGTSEGYITILLPEQKLGYAGELYLTEEIDVSDIQIEIMIGKFVETDTIPQFTTENVTYLPDDYFAQVTGKVVNPFTKQVDDVKVFAVLYDEVGDIIGGGYTYLDFIPAEGSAAVEVSVTGFQNVASVELYASITSLSDFE